MGTKHVYAGTTRVVSKLVKQDKPNSKRKGRIVYEKDLYTYHPDHLGTSAYITHTNGQVYQHLEYFPFGETWVEEHSNKQRTPYLFTAKELDEASQLYYFGARYYDPRVSVWQSPDPILNQYLPTGASHSHEDLRGMGGVYNAPNLALYSYTHNNPVVYTDPDGEAVCGGACIVAGGIAVGRLVIPAIIKKFAKKHAAGAAVATGTLSVGTVALNENQSDSNDSSSSKGRNVGDIEIPEDATPEDARDILADAGSSAIGDTRDDPKYGTNESGTEHEVEINGTKTKVRVMEGSSNQGPRISVGNASNPKQMVDKTTGKNFPNGTPKSDRIDKSHIPLKGSE